MRKSIFTGALLATALGGATAFGAVSALPAAASTGCGVTVHVNNKTTSSITVQWNQSDSRAKVWPGIAGPWAKLGSGSTTVAAGASGSKAFTLSFSCGTDHQYRVHYTQGSNSGYAYFPANTSNWTTNNSPNVNVK